MNRNLGIAIAIISLVSLGLIAYGSSVGFVVIENPLNTGDPLLVNPVFEVIATDADGITIDWTRDETSIAGTVKFEAVVINIDEDLNEIGKVRLDVNKEAYSAYVGSWVFSETSPQKKYTLEWDTTSIENGIYVLDVIYTVVTSDTSGGGGGGLTDVTTFSMIMDTTQSGDADFDSVPIEGEPDYTIPILLVIGIIAIVAVVVKRR